MEYFFARRLHEHADEPLAFYSEMDEQRYEVRKIEMYRDGRFGLAARDFRHGTTQLGDQAIPALAEINESREFEAHEVSKEEFEKEWLQYSALRKG